MNWREQAACRHVDLNWYFDDQHTQQALDTCATCPVLEHCLTYALEFGPDLPGIYGGMTQKQRRRLLKGTTRNYTHGTLYAYRTIRCRCQLCRDAHARTRKRQRRAKLDA